MKNSQGLYGLILFFFIAVLVLIGANLVTEDDVMQEVRPTITEWIQPELIAASPTATSMTEDGGWWDNAPTPKPIKRIPTMTPTVTATSSATPWK
ncbi:MAG: hypothetical protein JEZ06_15120 [Anaerolineaceae bacterium]|nr:hypothetical protein [Anaerolineaceae bacterium]